MIMYEVNPVLGRSETEMGSRRRKAPGHSSRVVQLIGALLAIFVGGVGVAHATIPASERAVLQNIYAYTNGAGWAHQTGWNGPPGTECTWDGVTCNAAGTTVTGLDLSYKNLYGVLPPLDGLTHLESFIIKQPANPFEDPSSQGHPDFVYGAVPALQGLKDLKTFIVNDAFSRSPFPALTGMGNLEHFECRLCGFSGSIGSLSGLAHLKYFYVNGNPQSGALSGSVPSMAGLSQLQFFRVDGNFTGDLPDLTGLTQLQTFDVAGYRFTGGVPNLVDLPNLQSFTIQGLLTGQIGVLSGLPSLQLFEARSNLLTGDIPSLAQLPSLEKFDVYGNRLTSRIPALFDLPNFQILIVGYNQLSGALPTPPQSLVDAAEAEDYPAAFVCPNLLTPASSPPSATDLDWNTITKATPWSQDCVPDPLWKTSVVELSSSLNPSLAGQTVTFTAAVRGMSPTGTVAFTEESAKPGNKTTITLCESAAVVDEVATCTTSDLVNDGSTQRIAAHYSGDANNTPADTGLPLTQQVMDAEAEVSSANPAQIGQPVDLTLTYGLGTSDDTVSFYDGYWGSPSAKALCSNVAVHTSRSGQFIAHCLTQFAIPGPHLLTTKGRLTFADPIIQHVVAATPFDADQFALTGPWYNPATSGQGLQFAVYPDRAGSGLATLVGGWFTYDASGHQRWMALQGNLSASHGGSYDLQVGQGSGGNFDAAPITAATAIGSAKLTFYDCGHAALTYNLDDGRSGTIAYARIDTPPYGCLDATMPTLPDPPPVNNNDAQRSGAWYNPTTSGQGVFVDLSPWQTSFFATWYTYAPQGNTTDTDVARQRWFTLQDNDYTPGDLSLHDVKIIASSGGVFGQPSAIDTQQVGSAEVTFTSCTSMTLSYTFDKGEFSGLSGTIDEQVLAANPACQ